MPKVRAEKVTQTDTQTSRRGEGIEMGPCVGIFFFKKIVCVGAKTYNSRESILLLCVSRGPRLGCPAWQQAPVQAEPPHWLCIALLKSL